MGRTWAITVSALLICQVIVIITIAVEFANVNMHLLRRDVYYSAGTYKLL